MRLNAVNDEGKVFELLSPFFEAILPAFEAGADEIFIEPSGTGLKMRFRGQTAFVPLPDSPHSYAMIVFSRILILSCMSIALEGAEQPGNFRARFNQQLIKINVTSFREGARWFMIFRPETKP